MRPLFFVLACLMTGPGTLLSQTLGVIGSSTAYGLDADPIETKSWVNLTKAWYSSQHQLTNVLNLAQSGATSYTGLPWSNFPLPAQGFPTDSLMSVTQALIKGADVIIVAFPSNDFGINYQGPASMTNWLRNLRIIRDTI